MKRARLALLAITASSILALGLFACGGGDDNADDSSATDSGSGTDSTVVTDSGPPADTGAAETGPFCNTTPCVIGLGAGGVHTCALISDGTVRCWGGNLYGALGTGTVIDGGTVVPAISALPLSVASNVVQVAGGGIFEEDIGFTCAAHANKTVDCWGFNEFGGLGNGDASVVANPTPQSTLLTNAIDVSAGLFATCAALSSGDVACWGSNSEGQINPPGTSDLLPVPTVVAAGGTKFTQVSVGYVNVCALTNDGHVWCWGAPAGGDTGHFTDGGTQDSVPAQVPGLDSVTSVAAGYEAACALKSDGTILCFGLNQLGLLGRTPVDGGPAFDPTPVAVSVPAGTTFTQLTSHTAGFCAVDTTSQVWCWGYNQNGETGTGILDSGTVFPVQIDVPTKVDGLTNVDQLSTGSLAFHVCALIHGGAVKCWGSNSFSELGFATPDGGAPLSITPVPVTF